MTTLEAHEDQQFYVVSGETISHVVELADALEDMRNDIYVYHTEDQDDFAAWIGNVFDEEELSQKVKHADDQHEAAYQIYKHLAHYHT